MSLGVIWPHNSLIIHVSRLVSDIEFQIFVLLVPSGVSSAPAQPPSTLTVPFLLSVSCSVSSKLSSSRVPSISYPLGTLRMNLVDVSEASISDSKSVTLLAVLSLRGA